MIKEVTYVIEDLTKEEVAGTLYQKEVRNANQTEFTIERVIKKKADKLYVKWNGYENSLMVGLTKKILLYKINYFP